MAQHHPLDPYVEWGGRRWRDELERGLDWLGDLAGLRLLDVGTRNGRMATWFARAGATVVAVDIADQAMTEASAFAQAHGVADRIDLQRYSGDPADLPTGFDVIFAKSVVVLMQIDAAVEGFAAALNDGGRILLIENARGPWPLHAARVLRRRSLRPHGAMYFTNQTVTAIRARFRVDLEHWAPPAVVIGATKR
ncbi:MAG: methyltransferase domain-containing protein [Chloroflexota bacterium]|nr:methyltransferase domain-containing protein [Chloroflexota bacterium]